MNKTLIAATVLSLSSGLALAAGTTSDDARAPAIQPVPGTESPARTPQADGREAVPPRDKVAKGEPFKTFDDNHDGLISGDELEDIKDLDLARVDRNHDGHISPAEYEAAGPFEQKSLIQKAKDALSSIGDSAETRATH